MVPVLALIGQPNVGKSTLFNRLTRSKNALVADRPGLTRDRIVGEGKIGERKYLVVDTGGLSGEQTGIDGLMGEQSLLAARQADAVLFLVDGRAGLDARDEEIATQLRRLGIQVNLLVNKTEGVPAEEALAPYHELGFKQLFAVSGIRGNGVEKCINQILDGFPLADPLQEPSRSSVEDEADSAESTSPTETDGSLATELRSAPPPDPRVAIIGRPNVGKSTLTNALLGEERVIAFDQPGTTRDSIAIPFQHEDQSWTLIDTAGVRRRSKVSDEIEKFSIIKTLRAIEAATVVIVLADANEGLTEQDIRILSLALDQGRALVLAMNKWDTIDEQKRQQVKREVERKLPFLGYARIHYISALRGKGLKLLMQSTQEAHHNTYRHFQTPELNDILQQMVRRNPPPLRQGRRPKPRYVHQGGTNPPTIVIHGTQCDQLPESYNRYLENGFRQKLDLQGCQIRLIYRQGENPFAGRKAKPTDRQLKRARRERRFRRKHYS